MLRYNSQKTAVIMAFTVILLCLTCITGATLALFTSDPDDGTIGIISTAGNVRLDIVDPYTEESMLGRVLKFQSSSEQQTIRFEPGATFATQGFKIRNVGNVPVNFRLSVSEDENINMEEFSKAFEIWISTDLAVGESRERLTEFCDRLEVDERSEQTYYLFVKMKESAGNEFQGKCYTGIGITVYAVQGNVNIGE